MKRLIGIFIIAQAVFVGILCYQLQLLGDSILQAASFGFLEVEEAGGFGNLPTISLVLLAAMALIGLYLMFSKNETPKQ
ncbi:hypothetical protein [Planomicrobium sp. CPCC 101079]|uniref:hypothetical protein n=1 Tax=Planomicrobium sp. CPCC 101079 TaxID=2599618 RepID=UPI0011B620A5|nr:hypothetical protein [Planomicrobium sp. CPCC 101079]TWT00511.1 hypothetical protein FQV28_17540 [Planomicrobium sp. CPCC 101079]